MSQMNLHYVRPQVLMKPECDGKIIKPQRQYQVVVVGFCFGWFVWGVVVFVCFQIVGCLPLGIY